MEKKTFTVEIPEDNGIIIKQNKKTASKKHTAGSKQKHLPKQDNQKDQKKLKSQKGTNNKKYPKKQKNSKNRHGLKESYRFRQFMKHIKTIALIIGCFIGVIILAFIFIYYFCGIKKINVEGNKVYTDKEIQEYILDDEYSWNAVYVLLKNTVKPKKDIEFIESVSVYMNGLNEITISVEEKNYKNFINIGYDNLYAYLDEKGNVIEITQKAVWLPELFLETYEPLDKKKPFSENAKEVAIYQEIVDKLQTVDTDFQVMFINDKGEGFLVKDGVTINLGDTDDIAQKMRRIDYIYPHIAEMTGILHMENWSQSNKDIIFERTDMPKTTNVNNVNNADVVNNVDNENIVNNVDNV